MELYTRFNSVREYMLEYARRTPEGYQQCYRMERHDWAPVHKHVFDSVFRDTFVCATNPFFALVYAIDILVEKRIANVSFKDVAPNAYYMILNPSGCNNRSSKSSRLPPTLEADIMNYISTGISTYWIVPVVDLYS